MNPHPEEKLRGGGIKMEQEVVGQIIELRRLGKSIREISSVLEVGVMTVRRYLYPEKREIEIIRTRRRRELLGLDSSWKDRRNLRQRTRRRVSVVFTTIGGRHGPFKALKRLRPDSCELCELPKDLLQWHHWDDSNLSLGLWLCVPCHRFAEGMDVRGLAGKYLRLKEKISEEGGLVSDAKPCQRETQTLSVTV